MDKQTGQISFMQNDSLKWQEDADLLSLIKEFSSEPTSW